MGWLVRINISSLQCRCYFTLSPPFVSLYNIINGWISAKSAHQSQISHMCARIDIICVYVKHVKFVRFLWCADQHSVCMKYAMGNVHYNAFLFFFRLREIDKTSKWINKLLYWSEKKKNNGRVSLVQGCAATISSIYRRQLRRPFRPCLGEC